MRFSTTVAAISMAAAPALVSATGQLGFCLGMTKTDNSCKVQSDYEADFDAIKKNTDARIVRTYSASQCETAKYILPAAEAKGFQVILGVWPDGSLANDTSYIKQYVPEYKDSVYAVTVGSEVLYRGVYDDTWLAQQIATVKAVLPQGVKVGTADSWNMYQEGKADAVIKSGVDILLANAFSYWQSTPITNATKTFFDDIQQALARVQTISASLDKIEFWVGETGWPTTGGTNYDAATASTANAQTFWDKGVCAQLSWGGNVFYFEAFDEPNKGVSKGDNGDEENEQHWGAMNSDRSLKFPLSC